MTYEIFKEYMERYEKDKEEEKRIAKYECEILNILKDAFKIEYNDKCYYFKIDMTRYDTPNGPWNINIDIVKEICPNDKIRRVSSKYVLIDYGEEYIEVRNFIIKYLKERYKEYGHCTAFWE